MAWHRTGDKPLHYNDVTMTATASQITSLTIVCSTVYSSADQRKHQSSASLAFVRGIHRRPVNYPHKGPVTRKMSPFDDVIMISTNGSVVLLTHTHSHTHIYIYSQFEIAKDTPYLASSLEMSVIGYFEKIDSVSTGSVYYSQWWSSTTIFTHRDQPTQCQIYGTYM